MTKRRITCLCLAVLLLMPMLFTGCSEEAPKIFGSYVENSKARVNTASVENDNYMLLWSDSAQRFALQVKATGQWFYSAPTGYAADDEISAPIIVDYVPDGGVTTTTLSGAAACLALDSYSSEKIENGFRAVYSFEAEKIAVTVEYLLHNDGLEIRIPLNGVQEETNHVTEIKVAPFMGAVMNDTGSYLMVPSGSGSLIYAKTSAGTKQTYSESVYGGDASEPATSQFRMLGRVYLPVFGAMNRDYDENTPDTGMLGVIENGAECAVVYAQTGGLFSDYSNVYAGFRVRAKEKVVYNDQGKTKKTGVQFSDEVVDCEYLSVRYIPLDGGRGDDPTYNGMAVTYRKYLQARGYLQDRAENVPALSVNMLGSTQITDSFFGIPYQTDVSVTTLKQTQQIVSELKEMLGDKAMLVSLVGYGQGGIANSVIGGGFKISSKVGKKSDLAALREYAEEHGIVLSMDYEAAQFQKSGAGISVGSDSAMRVSSLKAEVVTYSMNTGLENDKGLSWYLVARDKLPTVMDKSIAAVNKNGLGAVSFGSLNRIVYSDFRELGNVSGTGFAALVEEQLKQYTADGVQLVASEANAYVAMNADYVTEVPMHSSKYSVLSQDIPFYSMVFQGYVPLSVSSINLAVNTRDAYLQAIATGAALQFTLCDTLHESIQFDEDSAFVSSRYADWKDQIAAMVEESAHFYTKVGNQSIVRYEKHGDVSITEFENGLIVYVNYADEPVTYNNIQLEANSFIYR
ncbi:MAG: hypothetical protein IJN04_02495 [Clostridia bacterium]|nr:hypothetical protein [Clostridia bacterium]